MPNGERYRKKDSARLVWDTKPRRAPNPKDIEFQTAEVVIPNWVRDGGQLPMSFRDGMLGDNQIDKQRMNRLIWGDNLLAMQTLLAQGYEGNIDLIYIDPPFGTSEDYYQPFVVGQNSFTKEPSFVERLAYKDTWVGGIDSYLDMLYPRLQLMKRLLSERSLIFVHLGVAVSHFVKVMMDEIFPDGFRNQLVIEKSMGKSYAEGLTQHRLNSMYDAILVYSRSESSRLRASEWRIDKLIDEIEHIDSVSALQKAAQLGRKIKGAEEDEGGKYYWGPFDAPGIRRFLSYEIFGRYPPPGRHWSWQKERAEAAIERYRECERLKAELKDKDELASRLRALADDGVLFNPSGTGPRVKVYIGGQRLLGDLWPDVGVNDRSIAYPTAKSLALMDRILSMWPGEKFLVADFFCGSGSFIGAAEEKGLQWIACDFGKVAVQMTRTRLVQQDARPFLVENIGNYQREMIYLSGGRIGEMQQVILKLYGAIPRNDSADLGTRHSPDDGTQELVYVGYPDRPVTARRAEELARQAEKLDGTGYKRLVILAWDYDYNYSSELENRLKAAKQPLKTKIESRTIPPDIYDYLKKAKDEEDIEPLRGKIKFYEKPYLRLTKPQVKPGGDGKAEVAIGIERYVVFDLPVAEKEREKLQALIKDNFAVLIDYWAVDWDYDGYTFKSQWQDMRGNGRKTKVVATQATTNLATGKTYTIAVRLVDIFGNDAAGTVKIAP